MFHENFGVKTWRNNNISAVLASEFNELRLTYK